MADDDDYWQTEDLNTVKQEPVEDEPPSTTNMPVQLQQQQGRVIPYSITPSPSATPELTQDDEKTLEEERKESKKREEESINDKELREAEEEEKIEEAAKEEDVGKKNSFAADE